MVKIFAYSHFVSILELGDVKKTHDITLALYANNSINEAMAYYTEDVRILPLGVPMISGKEGNNKDQFQMVRSETQWEEINSC